MQTTSPRGTAGPPRRPAPAQRPTVSGSLLELEVKSSSSSVPEPEKLGLSASPSWSPLGSRPAEAFGSVPVVVTCVSDRAGSRASRVQRTENSWDGFTAFPGL